MRREDAPSAAEDPRGEKAALAVAALRLDGWLDGLLKQDLTGEQYVARTVNPGRAARAAPPF